MSSSKKRSPKPDSSIDHCVYCGMPVSESDEYEFSRLKRGRAVRFVHKECWAKMLRKGAFQ